MHSKSTPGSGVVGGSGVLNGFDVVVGGAGVVVVVVVVVLFFLFLRFLFLRGLDEAPEMEVTAINCQI